MNQTHTIHHVEFEDGIYGRMYLLVSKGKGGWPSLGALTGIAGGLLSVPVALLLWALSKFIAPVEVGATLNALSNILFALTLPLLASGACCLDLLESKFRTSPPVEHAPLRQRRRHLPLRHLHDN